MKFSGAEFFRVVCLFLLLASVIFGLIKIFDDFGIILVSFGFILAPFCVILAPFRGLGGDLGGAWGGLGANWGQKGAPEGSMGTFLMPNGGPGLPK